MRDDEGKSEIATRLEAILRDLRAEAATDDEASVDDIDTASDDEMFDLVKREIESTDFEISD
jgi:hypothetical protein